MPLRSHRPHTAGSSYTKRTRSLSTDRCLEYHSGAGDYQSDPDSEESLWQYYRYLSEKYQRPKLGLQQYHINEPSSQILRQSGIYRNPALTPGQKLYLLDKCHVYDMDNSKKYRTNSYLQILSKRFGEDSLYKPEYRFNDPRDYFSYVKFMKTPRPTARPVNAGYFTPRKPHHPRVLNDQKKQHLNIRSKNFLDKKEVGRMLNSSNMNQKLAEENTSNSSRRLSVSSSSKNTGNTATLRLHQQSKEISKISVKPS